MGAILAGVGSGRVTPSEANEIARLIETYVKTLEVTDLENRLASLETKIEQGARQR